MSTTYTGDDTNYPTSITIPSDGQGPIKAADVNPALEGLADAIAYVKARLRQKTQTWTADFSWTVPAGCTSIEVEGWAPGGGGACGMPSQATTGSCSGGGGGGASRRRRLTLPVTPGNVIDVTGLAGIGVGAVQSSSGGFAISVDGSDGGDVTIAISGGATLATLKGGQGGSKGINVGTHQGFAPGGSAPAGTSKATGWSGDPSTGALSTPSVEGGGGCGGGVTAGCAQSGGASDQYVGGAAGTPGTTVSSNKGGGGGGGGGAGPGGNGGAGGNGGNGVATAPTAGTDGGDAPANSGAGGGGGGGGGGSDVSHAAASGNGGDGGSGQVTFNWIGLDA